MEPRLKTHYENHVRPKLQEEFGFVNPHQIPRVVKVVLNVGVGEASQTPSYSRVRSMSLG